MLEFSRVWSGLTAVIIVFALGALSACVSRPVARVSWYDYETRWFNDPVGQDGRFHVTSNAVIKDAVSARAQAWAHEQGRADRAAETNSVRAHPKASTPRTTPPAQSPSATRPPLARIAAQPSGTTPVLGDGSVAGELLAGARRLLNLKALGSGTFLRHLLTVAAVDIAAKAPVDRFVSTVWSTLAAEQRPRTPAVGDLAFFNGVNGAGELAGDFAHVAVVESIEASGRIVCIGEVQGEVRRFYMTPGRMEVRRDEVSGVEMNTPLRRRSLNDGPDAPSLAGELLVGYGRP